MNSEKELLQQMIDANKAFTFVTKTLKHADKEHMAEDVKKILPIFMRQFYQLDRLTNRFIELTGNKELQENMDGIRSDAYALKERMETIYGTV